MSSRLAWAMLRVQDQPGVQNMILDKTKKVLVYSVEPGLEHGSRGAVIAHPSWAILWPYGLIGHCPLVTGPS